MSRRIFLTGGNGFVGSHTLAQLLEKGYSVCCAVRTQAKGDKILADFTEQKSRIDIAIVPDIVTPDTYDSALKSQPPFDGVIHVASPFTYGIEGSNLQFLEPAIKGTLNLLKSVKENAPNVKRVVLIGSSASVVDYENLTSDPPKFFTEKDWNPVTWEEALEGDQSKAYRGSKKFAELEAWDFIKKEKPHFDLVVLCPPAIFGPSRHSISSIKELNESNSRLWKFTFGATKDSPVAYMPVHTYIDVRDLATAQVQALNIPEAGNERFAISTRQFDFQKISDILRSHFPELSERVPLGKPGTSSLPPGAYNVDNSKVKNLLGIEFRPFEETILDTARFFLEIERNEQKA
ncbi:flavonol reductase [Hypoxylon trugodes]|uniref:flavonol reductase n=1 Tax=Hypoxylon trugodes TaxID=326681 RepID=UPI00219DA16D|nr:flavonol reductase [Hypoxylon trugodes]KAI1383594.1 flavonol reductase [Hypoxylon trugodes]